MGAAVAITRDDYSADGLRAEARRAEDSKQACRLLALAMVLDGVARKVAAEACGMDRQTLPDWVHRYNAEGIDGLRDRLRSGRPPGLSAAQIAELDDLVVAGPDPAVHRVVRWRCFDLREERKPSTIAAKIGYLARCRHCSNIHTPTAMAIKNGM